MITSDQITAVIPTKNRLFELERCVKSIYSVVKDIIIIDNNSSEDIQSLEKKYEKVHVYLANRNLGPCAAQNWGVQLADTEWVLLLDNDVELLKWNISMLEDILDPEDSVVSFRILCDEYFKMYSVLYPDHPDWIQEIPWFYGCANLIKRDVWLDLEGYNEKYFAYYQEPEFSARLHKEGYKIVYFPYIIFAHHDSEVERDYEKIAYWKIRNHFWFCHQYLPFGAHGYQLIKMFLWGLYNTNIQNQVKAYIDALKDLPKRDPITDEFFLKVWRK